MIPTLASSITTISTVNGIKTGPDPDNQPVVMALIKGMSSALIMMSVMAMTMTAMLNSAHADGCTLPKSYYKNVSCTNDSRYFLAVKDSGAPVALIDNAGKKVVDLSRYQKVDTTKIAEGLLPVQRANKVGYVNMQGREVVPAVYDVLLDEAGSTGWARPVREGRIIVQKNGKYGVITTGNKVIVPFSADITSIDDYQGGRVQVNNRSKGTLWLDKQGKVSKTAGKSNNNAAQSSKAPTSSSATRANTTANPSTGNQSQPFTMLYPHQQDGRWGFVDDKKVTMITYSFDEVMPFSEGLAGVRVANNWGFVNLGGELVIPFRFSDKGVDKDGRYRGAKPFTFKNGKAWIGSLKNGGKLCINKDGTNVGCD
ncbi:MAG: WG repeat-containing protein [Psychrobacter sp.]|nr:WG repeat-containing protein [Psychrobacter sp.]